MVRGDEAAISLSLDLDEEKEPCRRDARRAEEALSGVAVGREQDAD